MRFWMFYRKGAIQTINAIVIVISKMVTVRQHTRQAQADGSEGTQSIERKRKSIENSLLHQQHKHVHKHKNNINLRSCNCVFAYVKWKPPAQSESISPPYCFTASWWGTENRGDYPFCACQRICTWVVGVLSTVTCELVLVIVKTRLKTFTYVFFIRNIRCLPIEYRNKQCLRNLPQARYKVLRQPFFTTTIKLIVEVSR